jgi:hypothetical protein
LRALKKEPRYESDGSEAMETKQSIEQYKRASEDALHGLKSKRVEVGAVSSPTGFPASSSENDGQPENPVLDYDSFDSESNKLVTITQG